MSPAPAASHRAPKPAAESLGAPVTAPLAGHGEAGSSKPAAAAHTGAVPEQPAHGTIPAMTPEVASRPGAGSHASGDEDKKYAALQRSNAAITKKLAALEGKIKMLQDELNVAGPPVAPAALAAALKSVATSPAKLDAHTGSPKSDAAKSVAQKAEAVKVGTAEDGKPDIAKPADMKPPSAQPQAITAESAKSLAPHGAPPKPVQKHAPVPLKAKVPAAESTDQKAQAGGIKPTTVLGMVTGALLLLTGAGVHLWRRRQGRSGKVATAPSASRGLLRNPFAKKKPAAAPPASTPEDESFQEPGKQAEKHADTEPQP